MPIPYTQEELRAATHELIARNGLQVLLHPPARLPRLRADGPVPARRPVDVAIAVWEWGAYLGDEGKQRGIRAQGLLVAAHRPRLADPGTPRPRAST